MTSTSTSKSAISSLTHRDTISSEMASSSSPTSAHREIQKLELRPDRDLLDPHFESYKLSLDSPPIFRVGVSESAGPSSASLQTPLRVRQASEDQYSFLHAKLFSETNLLTLDSSNPDLVFLLDAERGGVWRVLFDKEGVSKAPEIFPVWIPEDKHHNAGDYNPSLAFAGAELAVLSDGSGMLHVLETGDRNSTEPRQWRSVFGEQICGQGRSFLINSAVAAGKEAETGRNILCLVKYVEEKEKVEGLKLGTVSEKVNFVTVVEWMSLSCAGDCWGLERLRRFVFYGSVDYLQLERKGESFYATTEKPFVRIYDSAAGEEMEEDELKQENESKDRSPPFYWFQGVEDMVVWVPLDEGETWTKRDIKVQLKPREMAVTLRDKKAIGGELWNVLDTDTMTWTIQGKKLEVNVCKANEGLIWQRFFSSPESDGLEISQPEDIDDIIAHSLQESARGARVEEKEDGPPTAFNSQELEECDALPDDSFALFAISGEGAVTHRVNLSGHQHLFDVQTVADRPSALCLRHDVDGLVWQPQRDSQQTGFVHVGTFPALGYVQASKEQRRFTVASPSMSYSAIVEAARRVYLYRQPTPIASEFDLRNRKSGRRVSQVAKQQVVTLESPGEGEGRNSQQVLGVAATDGSLVLITKDSIQCLNMK